MDSVVVVGAGTFGASLAWWLARDGVRVTLVDQFEPGDPRATSGGETRLIRCSHGADGFYTASARRARTLWRELEAEAGESLLLERGVAWFARRADGWEAESERVLREQGIPAERVDPASLFPSVRSDDLAFTLLEPEAGVLRAQRAVQALARRAAAHGATVERAAARPDGARVLLDDGRRLEADAVVWACGVWLAGLFGGLVSVRSTRQDLHFFDGGARWAAADVPAWVDYDAAFYGTPDIDGHGVKAAWDEEGPDLSPEAPLPPAGDETLARARALVGERFPALADAPLRGSKACRYEISPDSHFVAAPHPEHAGVWLLGGGSGHGFKHGPAMAELMAAALRGEQPPPARFAVGERRPGRSLRTAGSSR